MKEQPVQENTRDTLVICLYDTMLSTAVDDVSAADNSDCADRDPLFEPTPEYINHILWHCHAFFSKGDAHGILGKKTGQIWVVNTTFVGCDCVQDLATKVRQSGKKNNTVRSTVTYALATVLSLARSPAAEVEDLTNRILRAVMTLWHVSSPRQPVLNDSSRALHSACSQFCADFVRDHRPPTTSSSSSNSEINNKPL